jgi:hypothetical protein
MVSVTTKNVVQIEKGLQVALCEMGKSVSIILFMQ